MNCSTLGSLVLHYLPELAQTHIRWVGDAIQPSRPLLPPSPPALNLSQQQGLFQWIRVIIFFWTTKHNWSPRQPFFQIDFLEPASACNSDLRYQCWKNTYSEEKSDLMEAGTHQGQAKCACPMKPVGFEGVFWLQKLQSEVCCSLHAVRWGKFNFEYSYSRHTNHHLHVWQSLSLLASYKIMSEEWSVTLLLGWLQEKRSKSENY